MLELNLLVPFNMILALTLLIPLDIMPPSSYKRMPRQVPSFLRLILPKDNFSPESGGSVKPRTAMEEMSRQGTMRL